MKRNKRFIFLWLTWWLCFTFAACSGIEDELSIVGKVTESNSDTRAELIEYTINIETAGTLGSLVEVGNYSDAQKLIVTGNIAYDDVHYVDLNMRTVEVLDLSESTYESTSIRMTFLSDSTKIKKISLPSNITSISSYYDGCYYHSPFDGCKSLISITLSENVTSIGDYTFHGCSSLTNINIPEGVTSIGKYTFQGCSSLTSISIPQGVISIGMWAFYGCSSLTNINIPENVKSIGMWAFYGCSSLTCISIPEGVTSIEDSVFKGCSSLTSINIPEGVTSIKGSAFEGCKSLTSINIPEGMTSIGNWAFEGCSSLTSINIPESVTHIWGDAFSGCSSLTSINIPESLTNIGGDAFSGCSSLTSINIPESVTCIGDWDFEGCSSLTSINIPKGVTSIKDSAFEGCSSLTSINIPEGVTSIGMLAFEGCSSLTSIHIPEGVTSIGNWAFEYCSSLTSINIPESVTSIGGRYTFNGCNSLRIIKWNTSCSITDYCYTSGKLILYGTEETTSTEGYDITTAKQAIYTKYFSSSYDNSWYTISLPFKPAQITHADKGTIAPFDSDIEGVKNFWLRELTQDGYQDVIEMEAGHPYIIAMPTSDNYSSNFRLDGAVTFSAENVTINWEPVESEGPTYSMYPTYETVKKSKDVYVMNSEYWVKGYDYGRAWIRGAMDVEPLQAYIKLNTGTATMRSVLPMSDGKRTAVRGTSSSGNASSRGAYGHQIPRKEDM